MITPRMLLQRHANDIFEHLRGLYDGQVESVHRARIATRRVREVLPLAINPLDERLVETIRALGRQLGCVRDLDVMRGLLDDVAERDVATAGVAAIAKRTLRERQLRERRALIKLLDRIDLDRLRHVSGDRAGWRQWMHRPATLVSSGDWRSALHGRLAERVAKASDAVRRASGVYLPNRAHRARIAIKKLRYAVEVAKETGVWQPQRVLKDLRRVQETLGAIHDAQVLIDVFDELMGSGEQRADAILVRRRLEDDIARLHTQYLGRRDCVVAIGNAYHRATHSHRLRSARPLVAASVVALPLMVLGSRRQAS